MHPFDSVCGEMAFYQEVLVLGKSGSTPLATENLIISDKSLQMRHHMKTSTPGVIKSIRGSQSFGIKNRIFRIFALRSGNTMLLEVNADSRKDQVPRIRQL